MPDWKTFLKQDWVNTRNRWLRRPPYLSDSDTRWQEFWGKDPIKTVGRWRRPPHERYAARGKKWRGPRYIRRKAWRRDLLFFTSQLDAIVRMNAPLAEGLHTSVPSTPSLKLEHVVLALRAEIVAGSSLSEAMRALTRFFPRYYVDLIRTGEETGTLESCIQAILRQNNERVSSWKTVRGWFWYLFVMLCVMCAPLLLIGLRILPQFITVLAEFGASPPEPMKLAVRIGDTLWWWKWEIVLLVLLVLFPRQWLPGYNRLSRRRMWKRLVLRLPVFGAVQAWDNLAHVATVLKRLLEAGVPLDQALSDTAALDIDPYYQGILTRIHSRVERGVSLSEAAKSEPGLPASFTTLLSAGETSGMVPQALERLAALYEQQARTRTRILVETLSPLVVLIIGSGVLLITVSLFASLATVADVMAAAV